MDPVLVTERLVLRRITPADADGLLALDGDPEVMRYLDRRIKTRSDIESSTLPLLMKSHEGGPGFGYLAADTRADGLFIGWFGLIAVTPDAGPMVRWRRAADWTRTAEVGYRLRRSAWGRGYATEGTRALVRWAFTDGGQADVVATTMAVNAGSRRVMEKAGLRHRRTVLVDFEDPLDGTEHGEVEYGVRREDWARLGGDHAR